MFKYCVTSLQWQVQAGGKAEGHDVAVRYE